MLVALLLSAGSASAHLLNMSKSSVSIADDGNVSVELVLDLLGTAGSRETYWAWSQVSAPLRDPQIAEALAPLARAIALTANGEPITLTLDKIRFPDAPQEEFLDPLAWPRATIELSGELPSTVTTETTLLISYGDGFRFEEPIANTLIDEASNRKQTRWLVTGQRSPPFMITASASSGLMLQSSSNNTSDGNLTEAREVFADLSVAGFRHISPEGIDHLLFVAALLLGSTSLAGLVAIVTIFTLAHSLSLGLTALGWFSAPPALVEPLILLSIVWIALANVLGRAKAHTRYPVVLAFGLIHGLGFASALREIGLPADFLLTGLLAFNLGVEAAQLLFLFVLGAVLLLLERYRFNIALLKKRGSILIIATTLAIAAMRFTG